jgi:hypothetical protein
MENREISKVYEREENLPSLSDSFEEIMND